MKAAVWDVSAADMLENLRAIQDSLWPGITMPSRSLVVSKAQFEWLFCWKWIDENGIPTDYMPRAYRDAVDRIVIVEK